MASGHYITDSDIDNWPSAFTEALKQALIDEAEQYFDQLLGQPYWPKPFDVNRNGNGQNRIYLYLEADIITITDLWISGALQDPDIYTYDADSIFLNEYGSNTVVLQSEIVLISQEGLFIKGYRNIRACGTYGRAVVPVPIKRAVIEWVRWKNDPTLYSLKYKSESIGKYSYGLADTQEPITGLDVVDMLIRPFITGDEKPDLGVA